MADRIGVINKGELLLVEDKATLMKQMGGKQLTLHLQEPVTEVPKALAEYGLSLAQGGGSMVFEYDRQAERTGITRLVADLAAAGISVRDLDTSESSLEQIFLSLVEEEV